MLSFRYFPGSFGGKDACVVDKKVDLLVSFQQVMQGIFD
jgi:hypothetical protein